MTPMAEPLILSIAGRSPELHPDSWVATNATVIGHVVLAERASAWYGTIIRAEAEPIEIGAGTNIPVSYTHLTLPTM